MLRVNAELPSRRTLPAAPGAGRVDLTIRTEAEACFSEAIWVARRQAAKSLELRASTSLARFWQRHGEPEPPRGMLAAIYGRFMEGFATTDLRDAKALLAEL